MKKLAFIFLFVLCTFNTVGAQAQTPAVALTQLANMATDLNLPIREWEVIMKEQTNHENIERILKRLKNSYFYTMKEDKNSLQYLFGASSNKGTITETMQIIVPKKNGVQAEIIVKLKSDDWDEKIEENYKRNIDMLMDKLFSQSVHTFTCLTTGENDIIDFDYVFNHFAKKMDVRHVLTQTDTIANSGYEKLIYGFTPLWKQKIAVYDTPVNLHMAMRMDDGGKSTYTFGTPILINEY